MDRFFSYTGSYELPDPGRKIRIDKKVRIRPDPISNMAYFKDVIPDWALPSYYGILEHP
jgi:hypothetical protein